jgi:hypothetical protein
MHPCKVVTLIVFADASDRRIRAAVIRFVAGQIVIKHGEAIETSVGRTIVIAIVVIVIGSELLLLLLLVVLESS